MNGRIGIALLLAMQLTAGQKVLPGQRISVFTQNREVVEGKLRNWSDAGIEIARGNKVQSFALPDIRRVQVREKASRWKGAMWGAIIGFAAIFPCGAANAGYLADQNNPSFGTRVEIGTALGLFGAGIGAGIGALAGGHKYVTVYEAPGKRR